MNIRCDFEKTGTWPEKASPLSYAHDGKTALIVIDFHNFYLNEEAKLTPLQNAFDKAVARTRFLSERLRESFPEVEQIWVADSTVAKPDEDLRALNREKVLARYDRFSQKPQDPVFVKSKYDAFDSGWNVDTGQSLAAYLREKDVETVLLAGMTITKCVRETGLGALAHGFKPVCLNECIEGGIVDGSLKKERELAIDELYHSNIPVRSVYDHMRAKNIDYSSLQYELRALDNRLPPPQPQPPLLNRFFRHFGLGVS
jgi:nicotinamidase-related amidase